MGQRVYLVIVDETEEAARALRFAARRAARTGGAVHILALVPPQDFVAFSGVQATIEQEARERAETIASMAAGDIASQSGVIATIAVEVGEAPAIVRRYLRDHPEVSALVIGATPGSSPGPLTTHFTALAGNLPCVLMIVPGGISDEGIDAVS